MIGIRADANKIIASGHVMRCITIAREILVLGEQVTFFVADEESKTLIDSYCEGIKGLGVVVLGTCYNDMEGELLALSKELNERDIRVLLVDSYFVTPGYFEEISKICPVAYMDDLGKEAYPVDLLINYSGYYETVGYDALYKEMKGYKGEPTSFLLGLEYAPLRRQFYEEQARDDEAPGAIRTMENDDIDGTVPKVGVLDDGFHILLTAGGADMHGMLLATLEAAAEKGLLVSCKAADDEGEVGSTDPDRETPHQPVIWEAVAGALVTDVSKILQFADKYDNIRIHRSVTDMASLMRSCNIAITAAGTMLTECAAVRLPAIFYQVADNQKFNVEFWQQSGGMIFAGDVTGNSGSDLPAHSTAKSKTIAIICDTINKLLTDTGKLEFMKKSLEGITDGKGAIKIAKELIVLCKE